MRSCPANSSSRRGRTVASSATSSSATAALAGGILAPPVLLERTHFHLAGGLARDVGLRDVLRSNPDLVAAVPVAAHAPDVDLPDDLDRLSEEGAG